MQRLILLFLLLNPLAALSAGESKVIFNLRGEQFLTPVGPGTEITKEAEIIWETARDGEIPAGSVIGVLERVVVDRKPTLRESAVLRAAADAKAAAAEAEAQAKAQRLALIRSVDSASTVAQLRAVLKALVVELGKDR